MRMPKREVARLILVLVMIVAMEMSGYAEPLRLGGLTQAETGAKTEETETAEDESVEADLEQANDKESEENDAEDEDAAEPEGDAEDTDSAEADADSDDEDDDADDEDTDEAESETEDDLTDEEIDELLEIYERIKEIYDAVYEDDDFLTNREYRERVSPYEDELDTLEARQLELEAKAGEDHYRDVRLNAGIVDYSYKEDDREHRTAYVVSDNDEKYEYHSGYGE